MRNSSASVDTRWSATATMRSPWRTPARSAGPPCASAADHQPIDRPRSHTRRARVAPVAPRGRCARGRRGWASARRSARTCCPCATSSPSASCTNSEPMPTRRPVVVEQRGAAPFRMRRRGEQRDVEEVFPVAREFAAREHFRLERVRAPAVADHDRPRRRRRCARAAHRHRRHAERPQRQHEPEAGREIVGQRVARTIRGRRSW